MYFELVRLLCDVPARRSAFDTAHEFIDCVLLQYLALGRLREPEVHHLVQQLVDDDEVIPDGLLLELLEVLDEYLDDAVEE